MKRLICIALLCLLVAGVVGCGRVVLPQETTQAIAEQQWGVTIEEIDLSKPENQKYIEWAKKERPRSIAFDVPDAPKYFGVETPMWERGDEVPSQWDGWKERKFKGQWEKYRPWNKTKELVIPYRNAYRGENELYVRDRITGKMELIASCKVDEIGFSVPKILSDTRILYHRSNFDGYVTERYCIYDLETKVSICVASENDAELCDLGDDRYLWCDSFEDVFYSGSSLYLIDMRAFEAGEKDARRTLARWDDHRCFISYLSSDKRFVYLDMHNWSDRTSYRGVYDLNTGEQVALFEMPFNGSDRVLISDNLEYFYWRDAIEKDLDWAVFYIIHYDRTGDRP